MLLRNRDDIKNAVYKAVEEVKITDVHTHLYPPSFGDMLLWGIDELLNYHYLVAETMRWTNMDYEEFWNMSKKQQANLIWDRLFIQHSPYSEACRGVLTVLNKLGLNVSSRNLDDYRKFFSSISVEQYTDKVFETANIKAVVMTNDPFNEIERNKWIEELNNDNRFKGALRLDILLNSWPQACEQMRKWGYSVEENLDGPTFEEIKRFLKEWLDRMHAVYMAASLPYDFIMPENSYRAKIIENCVLPVAVDKNKPFAMMIGVNRQVNPALKDAGDAVCKADINSVIYLCAKYPHNKFMVTMLSRENQHELTVAARKFRNLMPFGCWWFLNNPSLVDEITRMRCELLGVSFIPQHSDARVLDQLIYKWAHSRRVIADVLVDKYDDLSKSGWEIDDIEINRDVNSLLNENFWGFIDMKL